MNKFIAALSLALVLACACFAEIVDKAQSHIETMRTDGSLTNVVKALMAQGDVCKISGHAWIPGRIGEGPGFVFADYHPNTSFEHCTICLATKTHTTVTVINP